MYTYLHDGHNVNKAVKGLLGEIQLLLRVSTDKGGCFEYKFIYPHCNGKLKENKEVIGGEVSVN